MTGSERLGERFEKTCSGKSAVYWGDGPLGVLKFRIKMGRL